MIEKKTSRAISRKIRDLRKPKVQNKAKRGKNASGKKKRVHGRAPISGTARPASDLARPGRARWHGQAVPCGTVVPPSMVRPCQITGRPAVLGFGCTVVRPFALRCVRLFSVCSPVLLCLVSVEPRASSNLESFLKSLEMTSFLSKSGDLS